MSKSSVINVNDKSPEFIADLKRRIDVAKKSKNHIQLPQAKKSILLKYRKLVRAKV